MAFDGITIACLAAELRDSLLGGRIHKIAQPEADELLVTCKGTKAADLCQRIPAVFLFYPAK